jgi:hypothetical protein
MRVLRAVTEEQAILVTLSMRYGDEAERMRTTIYSGMSLAEVCRALNREGYDTED